MTEPPGAVQAIASQPDDSRSQPVSVVQPKLAVFRAQMLQAKWREYALEWLLIVAVAVAYSGGALLDFDATQLQQSGEHNESATLPLLAEIGLRRYGEIPLWNPYMLTGFPHVGDPLNHFWSPLATLPVLFWGGINGMKVSIFLAFVLAGIGQWLFAHVFGLRGLVRLWAALLFMLSGGLALLWRAGWYELLLGIAWFPWCFAALWWALHRRDRAALAWTALGVAMVLTTGGGYYPFYLLVSLSVLMVMALMFTRAGERLLILRRGITIALLSAALLGVMLLPLIDGYRSVIREAGVDAAQRFSQPIPYALLNYVISEPGWYRSEVLGTAGGWNWFYIGTLPMLAALSFTPFVFVRTRRRRIAIILLVLIVVLLAWHANRHTPVRFIYDWIPFLYNLRFPNRLLILIASPLIVFAALGLQHLFSVIRLRTRASMLGFSINQKTIVQMPLRWFWQSALILIMVLSIASVYEINQGFAFAPRPLNAKAYTALRWLKEQDAGLYYTNIGGGAIYWDWASVAYDLEMPMINFDYNRRLVTYTPQRSAGALFYATPKYMLAQPDQPRPDNAQALNDFDGVGLWYLPDALPFAFSVPAQRLLAPEVLTHADVATQNVAFDGPNRVVVTGNALEDSQRLIVLVSNYPGWRLYIDGQPAELQAVNDYLAATLMRGEHTYTFSFEPTLYQLGLIISLAALAITLLWIVHPRYRTRK